MDQPTQQPSTLYKTFGIISLVLGILAFLFSFIPCLGMYAMFPAILGIVFGVIGFVLAGKVNGAKGMIIAGIVLSVIATVVAVMQYKAASHAIKDLDKTMNETNASMDSIKRSMDSSFKATDSALKEIDSATAKP